MKYMTLFVFDIFDCFWMSWICKKIWKNDPHQINTNHTWPMPADPTGHPNTIWLARCGKAAWTNEENGEEVGCAINRAQGEPGTCVKKCYICYMLKMIKKCYLMLPVKNVTYVTYVTYVIYIYIIYVTIVNIVTCHNCNISISKK